MNERQIATNLELLKARVIELEQQVADVNRVLNILLQSVKLESKDKAEMVSILEVEVALEPEKRIIAGTPQRTIQELLDESQKIPRRDDK